MSLYVCVYIDHYIYGLCTKYMLEIELKLFLLSMYKLDIVIQNDFIT